MVLSLSERSFGLNCNLHLVNKIKRVGSAGVGNLYSVSNRAVQTVGAVTSSKEYCRTGASVFKGTVVKVCIVQTIVEGV